MQKVLTPFKSIFLFLTLFLWVNIHAQTTQIRAEFCGATLGALGTNIFADGLPGAQIFRFRIINQNTGVTTIFDRDQRFFNLINAGANPLNNQTFLIDVAVNDGNGFGSYGSACLVHTPVSIDPQTQLRSDFCNLEIAAINTNIYADGVNGTIMYRYRIHNLTTGVTTIYDRDRRWFNLVTAGANPQVNQILQIDVALDQGTGFGAYGPACLVYTPIMAVPTTQLRDDFCGVYLPALGSNIFANSVLGATMYRFRIQNVITGTTIIYDRTSRWFNLIHAGANPQITQQFLVDVAVNTGAGFGAYGPACNVFTPHLPPTQIQAFDCGTTKEWLFYEFIHAIPNTQASFYQFRIRTGAFEALSEPTELAQIKFSDFVGVNYGMSYNFDVRFMRNGVWGPFGPACTISTIDVPTTQVQTNQFGGNNNCGWQLPSVGSNIHAFNIPFVNSYKFRVSRNSYVDSIVTPIRRFRLIDLPNFSNNAEFGAAYNVEVAVELNGNYTEYGVMCQVFTPSPTTQLRADFCGVTLTALGQNIFAEQVTGAHQYRFEIDNGSTITTFTTNNRWFNLISAGVAAPNTLYSIRVAIGVNGNFYPYGAVCTVLTPGTLMAENLGIQEAHTIESPSEIEFNDPSLEIEKITLTHSKPIDFNFSVYPNPFSGSFQLSFVDLPIDAQVNVTLFDASGSLLHSGVSTLEQTTRDKFGMDLAPGLYFVRVETSGISKFLRVIKN